MNLRPALFHAADVRLIGTTITTPAGIAPLSSGNAKVVTTP